MKNDIRPSHFIRIERDENGNPQYSLNVADFNNLLVIEAFEYKRRGLYEVIISTYNIKEECKLINEFI